MRAAENVTCAMCRGAMNILVRVEENPTEQVREEALKRIRLRVEQMKLLLQQRRVENL